LLETYIEQTYKDYNCKASRTTDIMVEGDCNKNIKAPFWSDPGTRLTN